VRTSDAFSAIDAKLKSGNPVIIDGGTGTELELRGVEPDPGAWSGPTWLDRREILQGIHEDYIRAGADVVITNTFCTARHQLEPVGYGDLVERANHEAVEVALAARHAVAEGRSVAIAGSVSHAFANAGERFRVVERDARFDDAEALRASYREQIALLAEAGVDLLALETMQRPETARIALEEALASDLPVWLGLSVGGPGEDGAIYGFDQQDVALSDTLDALLDERLWAVLIMHTEVEDTAAALEAVRSRWSGPIGAYPHSGFITFPNWHHDHVISQDGFVAQARIWRDAGAALLGGCCGIGPGHIAALNTAFA